MNHALFADAEAFVARANALAGRTRLRAPSLPDQIADWILDRIQFGDLKPSEPIRETAVAEYFDVSRGPVRDALRLLDRSGLVTINAHKGAVVRAFSAEETDNIFRVRADIFACLCGEAAAAPMRDQAAVAALGEGAALLERIAADPEGSVEDYIRVRRGIARLIVTLSGDPYMSGVSAALEREVAVLWASVLNRDRRKSSAASWQDLCSVIAQGRRIEAERLGAQIVLNGLAEVQRRVEPGADSPAKAKAVKKTRRR